MYQQLEQALAKIENNVLNNREMAEQIARSPWAIKAIKDLEAAIATFAPSKPIVEYQLSQYATGNNRWKCAPSQYPVPIQDLLLQDIQACQRTNKILGEKIEKIVSDNEFLAQQASSIHDSPSEKLRKSPIMNILTRTITTYMLLHNMNKPKNKTNWANLFSKERSETSKNK